MSTAPHSTAAPAPSAPARPRRWGRAAIAGVVLWLIGLGVPLALDQTWVFIASLFAVYAIVALSQDIVLGRAGMFDMGHAVYFGVGAYATAILNTHFGWPILATWPIAHHGATQLGSQHYNTNMRHSLH
jgi:ABC-type branched-subunit amino acid transport system permease subunit